VTTPRTVLLPPGREEEYATWHLAPAVRVGDAIHCSGVLGTRPDGGVPETLAEQVDLAFDSLASVLAVAGAGLEHVVDLLTFHLDLRAEVPTFMTVRDRRLSEPWPAWTAIGVSQLAGGMPGVCLEVKATAYL
jgi:enamine deaminase RidA (YjgF/YER057c/UK114 family)